MRFKQYLTELFDSNKESSRLKLYRRFARMSKTIGYKSKEFKSSDSKVGSIFLLEKN